MSVLIGDTVEYKGRKYIVRGFARAGGSEQLVLLEDAKLSKTFITAPLAQVANARNGFANPG